ncbi:MAG: S8 family serine peptidase [Candidatus Sumerlaeaceae bacterium]
MNMWRKRCGVLRGAKKTHHKHVPAHRRNYDAEPRRTPKVSPSASPLRAAVLLVLVMAWFSNARATDLIVRIHPSKAKTEELRQWVGRYGLSIARRLLLPGAYLVSSSQPPSVILPRLREDPVILYATPQRRLELCATLPNDPLFANQWQLRNIGQNGGLAGADINVSQAWDITTGSAHTVLAIVDSGVELTHPDLIGQVWTNPGEIPANGLDDDANGFVDDVHGWNFYSSSPDVSPTLGHGTNVAGLAGAASNNGIGVAGVNWQARLMIVNIFSPAGYATEADAADAIVYACDNGARVINASWGSPGYSQLLTDAVEYARSKGVLICAAAGNYNFDADEHPFYPAAIGSDALLGVGGTTNRDDWIYNYGAARVQIAAPANLVYMARYPSTYGYGSGTSYAAPLVTGAAGLLLAIAPDAQAANLRMRLVANAARPVALAQRNVVGGRLDVLAALSPSNTVPLPKLDITFRRIGAHGALVEVVPPDDWPATTTALVQIKKALGPITTENFPELPEWRLARLAEGERRLFLLNELEPGTDYWIGVRTYDAVGIAGDLTTATFRTSPSQMIFYDSCDTTSPVWQANGFTLAGGDAHTGSLAWQDSPDTTYTSGTIATLTGGPFDISGLARPRLSFYLEHFFPSRLAEGDRLEVRVSTDHGATWKVLRRFHATVSPLRRFCLPLDDLGPAPALFIQFRLVADANAYVDDGVYLDDIALEEAKGDVPFADDVIVESYDFFGEENGLPEFERVGPWSADAGKSSAPKLVGAAVFSAVAGTTATRASFIPFVPMSGDYEVFLSHGALADAAHVKVEIIHADGIADMFLDQSSASSNRWISLGVFSFVYGRDKLRGRVSIDTATATGTKVFADAVRLILVRPAAESLAAKDWSQFE